MDADTVIQQAVLGVIVSGTVGGKQMYLSTADGCESLFEVFLKRNIPYQITFELIKLRARNPKACLQPFVVAGFENLMQKSENLTIGLGAKVEMAHGLSDPWPA